MTKWFWETYLLVAAVLLILGISWIFAATAYLMAQGVSSVAAYDIVGVVATGFGVYSMLTAQKLYTESQRNGGIPPVQPQNAR